MYRLMITPSHQSKLGEPTFQYIVGISSSRSKVYKDSTSV
jgi:hypothetical protein